MVVTVGTSSLGSEVERGAESGRGRASSRRVDSEWTGEWSG